MPKSKEDVQRELNKDPRSKEKESRAIDQRGEKEMKGKLYKSEEKP